MNKVEWKEIKHFIIILFCIFLFVLQIDFFMMVISFTLNILSPLLIGIVMSFLLNRVMVYYEKALDHFFKRLPAKVKRIIAIVLSFITFLLFLVIIINIIVPELILSVIRLTDNFNVYINNLTNIINQVFAMLGLEPNIEVFESALGIDFNNFNQLFGNIFEMFSQQISKIIPSVFSFTTNIISNVVNFFIAIFISIYLLLDKEKIFETIKKMTLLYLKRPFFDKASYVMDIIIKTFNRYIVGQLIEACILGTLCFIGMMIFRFDYALLISVLVGITALVPILGAFIGGGVSFFLLLMISPVQAFLFLVFLLVLQQFDNNLIYPHVVGSSLGLPPLLVLLAIPIGGAMFGLIGMVLAVPILSVIYTLIKNDVDARAKKRAVRLADEQN